MSPRAPGTGSARGHAADVEALGLRYAARSWARYLRAENKSPNHQQVCTRSGEAHRDILCGSYGWEGWWPGL